MAMCHGILKTALMNQSLELEYRPIEDGGESSSDPIPSPAMMSSLPGIFTEQFAQLLSVI
jgi:hypothetical protein